LLDSIVHALHIRQAWLLLYLFPCNYTQLQLDGCIVWNAHNTVLSEEALLIHIVPVGYAT